MFCYIYETTDEPQHLPDVLLGIMLPKNSSNLSCRDKGSDPEGPVGWVLCSSAFFWNILVDV